MKVVRWLSDRLSARIGHAVVRCEPGEVPDVLEMLKLVDGDCRGHFGISVSLVAAKEGWEPDWQRHHNRPGYMANEQGVYPPSTALRELPLFFKVLVSRD